MQNEWWRGAVFYQIYPRSFYDTNNDGVGDLKGITTKLDYVAGLGVDALWISPFCQSPMKDFGYDVSDYRAIDPLFGTMDDFDDLLAKAHDLGLKIILDLVLNHTSDQHPWFKESRQNRDNAKADWYVWANPKPDGTPPNNWMSVFGGPAWTFETKRGQYYLHNFLKEQPDLNYHNPGVRAAILDMAKYWLDKGVDGFRLDTVNFYTHDKELRDNPPHPDNETFSATQIDFKDPYGMQQHIYDKSRPENLEFIATLRALSDNYPGTVLLGEIGDDEAAVRAAEYTSGPDRLHTAYNFSLMTGIKSQLTAPLVCHALEDEKAAGPQSWPSWAFSNHDVVRAPTRFGGEMPAPALKKLLIALLSALRGTAFLYQGEELGLPDAKIPFEKLQDPWAIALWPEWQGRDGCRTPMPWDSAAPQAGFNAGTEPWLPIDEAQKKLAVSMQEQDENSTLNFTRKFLKWRKTQPALIWGDIEFHDTGDDKLLAFTRTYNGAEILCLFNLDDGDKRWKTTKLGPYGFSFSGAAEF